MTLKYLYGILATPWYWVRPIEPRHSSREAWLAHCKKTGKSPDGVKR